MQNANFIRLGTFSILLMVLFSCSSWTDYEDVRYQQNFVKQNSTYAFSIDSLILYHDSIYDSSFAHQYESYQPENAILKNDLSKDASTIQIVVKRAQGTGDNPLSLSIELREVENDSSVRNFENQLYLDIYGCAEASCKSAYKMILRDRFYDFTEQIVADQFVFSAIDFVLEKHGNDCKIFKERAFNVKAMSERFRIDWDVQFAYEICQEEIPNAMFAKVTSGEL